MTGPYSTLTTPARMGSLQLRNRMVLAAMGSNFADTDGSCSEQLLAYYEARARGGAGLLILETSAACWPNGATMPNTVGFSEDRFLPGLTDLTGRVHRHGAKIVAQLNHGGKMAQEDTAAGRPIPVPSPVGKVRSDMFNVLTRDEIGHFIKAAGPDGKGPSYFERTEADIDGTVDQFADAARRARQANFDGIELHAGHGYLLANFLSPATNRRDDRYGGSIENRARFLTRIIARIRQEQGQEFPILVRLDAREYRIEGGITPADCVATAMLCEQAGATAIDVSAYGNTAHAIAFTEAPLVHEPEGFVDFARAVKAAVSIPVIAVGRIEPASADRAIQRGDYDFLALGRKLLADPELPNKLASGRAAEIRPCIYCYVCVSKIFINTPMLCAVNHDMGRESTPLLIGSDRSGNREKILVIGAGPAGMESARLLSMAGHSVSLWEKTRDLGGTARIAALAYAPNEALIDFLAGEMRRLPVDLKLGRTATPESLAREHFHRIIVATGAVRRAPAISGRQQRHVFDGEELRGLLFGDNPDAIAKLGLLPRLLLGLGRMSQLLRNIRLMRFMSRLWLPLADDIVVIGGGLVGLELAEYLVERGRRITVLEPSPHLGAELSIVRRGRVLHQLREHGVRLESGVSVSGITADAVVYEQGGETHTLPTRQVIIAMGAEPNRDFVEAVRQAAPADTPVHAIGDCHDVGYIEGAIHSARRLVQELATPAAAADAQAPAREAMLSR